MGDGIGCTTKLGVPRPASRGNPGIAELIVPPMREFPADQGVLLVMRPSSDSSAGKPRRIPTHAEEPGSPLSSEALLDVAVECTFPASDPIAIQSAFDRAKKREGQ